MKPKICLSIGAMDVEFQQMVELLSLHGDVTVVPLDGYSLAGYDIFIGKKLTEALLDTADRLRIIFAYKTGVDDFPMEALRRRGITLVNSHADADYIAEFAFGMAISLVSRITEYDKLLRQGIWHDESVPYWESIFSMKVGLLGYGHIGREIHKILRRNGIPAYTVDRGGVYEDVRLVDSVESLCRAVDLVIVSLPKTPETDRIFDRDMLKLLRGKYLVNVGRSNCIDEEALYEALKDRSLAGAAIDTWQKKPSVKTDRQPPSRYPFTELPNIIVSPHRAMFVYNGHGRYLHDTYCKVVRYINGEAVGDVVDLTKGY